MRFFDWLFHRHDWKVISGDITGSVISDFAASMTIQCESCQKKKYVSRGVTSYERMRRFPSHNAAKVWLESKLPEGAEIHFSKPTLLEKMIDKE